MTRLIIFIMFFSCGAVSQAVLPHNAGARQKDVFAYRQRKLDEFEKAQRQHELLMISRDRQVRRELAASPWSGGIGTVSAKAGLLSAGQVGNISERRFQRWTISIIALLFIGGGVWWVRAATEREVGK